MSIFGDINSNPKYNASNSWSWFMRNVRDFASSQGVKPMALMGDHQVQQVTQIAPGSMYMYFYDPKTKEKLPYYDTFPLVIPFSASAEHFTGINMHYLFPKTRLVLLTKLLNFANDDTLSDKTRLQLSWRLLRSASKFPEVRPAVKMYLKGHVKSKFLKIPAQDWHSAIFLPMERFRGAEVQKVWKDSSRRI